MSLTARSGAPTRQASATPLPLVVAGVAAGAAAAVLSYLALVVIALAAWMLDPSGSQEWTQMLEVASGAWLAGQGSAITVDGVALSLLPLGFAILPVATLIGAARWATDASAVARRGEATIVALASAAGFAAVAAVIAMLSRSLDVPPARAALIGGVLAFAVTVVVCVRRASVLVPAAIPALWRDIGAATAVAVLALVAMAGVLLAAAVIIHVDEMTALLVGIDAGLSGLLLLAVLTLAYVPTALVWAIAYLLGPGVTVSAGVVVSPYAEPAVAALPGFPLLAALPGEVPVGTALLPMAGVAAGALAGALLRRRGQVAVRGALAALATAVIAGGVLALSAWLAAGSLGDTTLRALGPAPLSVGLVGVGVVALGAVGVAVWPARRADG